MEGESIALYPSLTWLLKVWSGAESPLTDEGPKRFIAVDDIYCPIRADGRG